MKLAITVRADDNIKEMTDITFPYIKSYARYCGADFIQLDGQTPYEGEWIYKNHYRIMDLYNLYEKYDRILSLDADILISDKCPNLFYLIPPSFIGSIYEDIGSRQGHRRSIIQEIQTRYGDVGWNSGYINSGVFMTSRCHREIFRPINGEYWTGWGCDDIHMGYLIHKHKMDVMPLPFTFNHMTMFSEPWNDNANRFDSYIIHYAGKGVFDKENRLEQIKYDSNIIYNKNS